MSTTSHVVVAPGFPAPVRDAQQVFRGVLEAMARPLQPQPLRSGVTPPSPLAAEPAAIVLALCDEQTPLWLDDQLRRPVQVAAWLRFHTGAPIVDDAAEALFCLASSADTVPEFGALQQGTDEQPHHSATVIVHIAETSQVPAFTARGPGIPGETVWCGTGLPSSFLEVRQQASPLYPRGVDVLLTAPQAVQGLPRTTVLTPKGNA